MRTTQYLLSILKETPHDSKIISHQLMLKTGMIRKVSSGIYIWLPTGIRVLNKITKIIKKEMNKINAIEILMPIVQPIVLWKKSGRLDLYGKELFKLYDRQKHEFILGPTNEEIITDLIRKEICSFRELPLIMYQIQTKFRDEIRPRFGMIRSREFIMKDAYSFHINKNCLEKTYHKVYNSYINILNQMQLKFRIVKADSGSMGGNVSHEFQALSENGEDEIAFSNNSSYAENINTAQSIDVINFLKYKNNSIEKNIINQKKIKISKKNQIKTILVRTLKNNNHSIAALLIRSDHELNFFKLEKINFILKPLKFLSESEVISYSGVKKEFLGPLNLKIPIIADISLYEMKNFTIGANIENKFFKNMNWSIDLPIPIFKDIRKVTKNDISPDGSGLLNIKKSIEIGHIFQLDKQYSQKMKALISLNKNQKNLYMGCYGIGITRMIAAVIEQNHDSNGIIWPDSISPFEVVILPINMHKSIQVKTIAETLYKEMKEKKIDVLIDDRNERPGIIFNEMDLIGIPHQIIISDRCINNHNIEYRSRIDKNSIFIQQENIVNFIIKKLKNKKFLN
ncbi:proline--tRNA ligase [Buchnera aphidicola (Muscaphis stroyani)]|uniref:Proline--tRNA ligase n=1 Tax=Buchnera aphidicola (Muscaphis stroyani) TaxID=1241869 RepID=A0A4D6Y7B7_9GAMM|nr:proline--tRNA ligase [Buchnera aphidicola]QCI24323.1 proline--tRNA ligase [Buchnera aphidicola (Muscaphis stroyani)]